MRNRKTLNKRHFLTSVAAAILAVFVAITAYASGTEQNRVSYNAKNEITAGTYAEPEGPDGYKFLGWATSKAKADAGTIDVVDFYPTPNDLTNTSLNGIQNGETKTVYAVWQDKRQKYAVMIYGIGQDTLDDGTTGGLTFGPATGRSYVDSTKSHSVDGETTVEAESATDTTGSHHNVITGADAGTDSEGNTYRCIHYDNWKTIIYWNRVDPHVYDKCVDNDCTHSVVLLPSSAAQAVTFTGAAVTGSGDGAGMLYSVLIKDASDYRNLQWNKSYSATMNYAGSRIRAMLNGSDDNTLSNYAGNDVTAYTEETCLLSAFPEELRNAIGRKAVHYATSYNNYLSDNIVYDKLWLFSNQEIYGTSISSYSHYNYSSEGQQYQRLADAGVTTSSYSKLQNYRDASSGCWWWLRSLCGDYYNSASIVNNSGSLNSDSVYYYSGVAPGFVLSRS